MRKILIQCCALSLCVCFGVTSFGKTVDENTAKTIGSNYLYSINTPGVNSPSDLTTVYKVTDNTGSASIVDFYIFNINNANGFVIVSADDNVIPILGYSNQLPFSATNIAPSAKAWFEWYQKQITHVISANVAAKAGTAEEWNKLSVAKRNNDDARTTSSFPSNTYFLCATTYDQYPQSGIAGNYNGLCPSNSSGRAVTGCVATAMTQVMKFWSWPTVGNGQFTYTPPGYSSQTADFGNTTYQWSAMPNALTSGNNIPLETILWNAGVSVAMQYGPSSGTGSGSYVIELETPVTNCAEYALKEYFHYKRSLQGFPRFGESGGVPAAIPVGTWLNMLEAEFNAGRPVIYSGQSTTDGGHCWVADGYGTSNLIHFNWGWSGFDDGWYSVDNLDPSAISPSNFDNDQCAIMGIQPDPIAANTGSIKMLSHLDCPNNSPMTYVPYPSLTAKILNSGTTSFSGVFAVQTFDTLNNLTGTLATSAAVTIPAGDSSALLSFTSTSGDIAMIPGPVVFHVYYKATGSNTWTIVGDNGSFLNYNLVYVVNSNGIEIYDSIHCNPGTTITQHNPLTVTTEIANFTAGNWSGSLEAILVNTVDYSTFLVQELTSQSIASDHYNSYTFTNAHITAEPGNYVLAIEDQTGGTGSFAVTGSDIWENPVFVKIVRNVGVNTPTSLGDNVIIYPNPATDVLYIAPMGSDLTSVVITDIQGREMMRMEPSNSNGNIKISTNSFPAGVYLVQLQSGNEVATRKIVISK